MKRITVPFLAGAVMVTGAVLGGACTRKDAADAAPADSTATVTATVAVAVRQPFAQTIGAIGTVAARAGHYASLSAPGATRVTRILVTTGQSVTAGEALIELDPAAFEPAVRAAQAAVTTAQANRDRQQRLVDQGIAPRRDLDQSSSELVKAQADLATAQRNAGFAVIRAPFAGIVTRMSASYGASVDANQPLIDIADPKAVDVLLSVQPSDAGRVRIGSRVSIRGGQDASADTLADGVVMDIAGAVDTSSRTVAVRVRIDASRRPLRLDESVFGVMSIAERGTAVTVPTAALVPEGDGYKVFVVDSANIAHGVAVKVGGTVGGTTEVLEGVSAGDKVVSTGAFGVNDGAHIVAPGARAPADSDTRARKPAAK